MKEFKFAFAQLVTASLLSPAWGMWPFERRAVTVTETTHSTITLPECHVSVQLKI